MVCNFCNNESNNDVLLVNNLSILNVDLKNKIQYSTGSHNVIQEKYDFKLGLPETISITICEDCLIKIKSNNHHNYNESINDLELKFNQTLEEANSFKKRALIPASMIELLLIVLFFIMPQFMLVYLLGIILIPFFIIKRWQKFSTKKTSISTEKTQYRKGYDTLNNASDIIRQLLSTKLLFHELKLIRKNISNKAHKNYQGKLCVQSGLYKQNEEERWGSLTKKPFNNIELNINIFDRVFEVLSEPARYIAHGKSNLKNWQSDDVVKIFTGFQ